MKPSFLTKHLEAIILKIKSRIQLIIGKNILGQLTNIPEKQISQFEKFTMPIYIKLVNEKRLRGEMNILSSEQFENRLAENTFSEASKYRILLASQLIFWFSSLLGNAVNLSIKHMFSTLIYRIAFLVIVFIGIKACYSVNKRIDDTGFIERFTLLFFPISLKFILFFLIIFGLVVGIIQTVFFSLGGSPSAIKEFNKSLPYFLPFIMVSLFNFMLYRSFLRLEQKIKKRQFMPTA